ncbi:probable 28S rRNA (cytosine-C(5))-methyltransferase [Chelonus insularis]|uniref:probable 28S rRNA (cytosine-C(5))-methyltransferase n=1 Tax=Chelonus insularis TaxID=460826 RepID=UPI00158CFEAC|nr:probable 28S rRNA (cytosine-C(5))-methyltransferase [Chelonus insularis]
MSGGFIHSVKVPRIYKTAANIVKQVTEDAASLKQLIYDQKHLNVKALYALTAITLQHASQLEEIIRNTQILSKESRLDPWLARILISELFWGKQSLKSNAKPVLTIQNYESLLREELNKINQTSSDSFTNKRVKKPRFVRINTLILNIDEAIHGFKEDGYIQLPRSNNYNTYLKSLDNLGTWEFIQDFHIPELIAFAPGTTFHDHSGYHTGAILLQDKASCLPSFLLNPTPGSVVLDTCAAPGMKTTHLAAIMKNEGKIYAIEKNNRRYETLCQFIELTKAHIVETIHENASYVDSKRCPDVEFILVDPSCSGSGMDRPEFDQNDRKCDPNRLKSLQSFQVFMLKHALSNFPKAKKVVYSTCSIYPEENEMVIDEILAGVKNSWQLVPITKLLHNKWNNYSSMEFNCKNNCLYAKSDEDLTSGFFVAIFERNFDIPVPEFKKHKVILENHQHQLDIDKCFSNQSKKNNENKLKLKFIDDSEPKKNYNNKEEKSSMIEIIPMKATTDEKLNKKNIKTNDKRKRIEELNENLQTDTDNGYKMKKKKKKKTI